MFQKPCRTKIHSADTTPYDPYNILYIESLIINKPSLLSEIVGNSHSPSFVVLAIFITYPYQLLISYNSLFH